MLFDRVTADDMQAARIVTGAVMAGFIAARAFGRHAWRIRLIIAGLYGVAVVGFILHYLP